MIFFACEKDSSANGNRERQFFFTNRSSNQKPQKFYAPVPALGVCSVLTSQLLNNKKIVVFFAVINIFKRSEVRKEVTKGALPKLRGNFK